MHATHKCITRLIVTGTGPDLCLATGVEGGGVILGCLRTGQATHPPKLTHPPTHPDPPLLPQWGGGPPVGGGGLVQPASYVHCILKILPKCQGPKVQNCKNLGLNPRLRICSAGSYHWTTSCYISALLKYFVQAAI